MSTEFDVHELNKLLGEVTQLLKGVKEEDESDISDDHQLSAKDMARPAMVEGSPMQIGTLRDGRPIYVAADKDGQPWKDSNGEWVVIDPQTGQTRHKLPRRHAQNVAPMRDIDNTKLAVSQLKGHEPGFLAWSNAKVSDVHPPIEPKPRFAQKVHGFVTAVVTAIVVATVRCATWFVKFMNRLYLFHKEPTKYIHMEPLPGIEAFLGDDAKALLARPIKSTLYTIPGRGAVGSAEYASMRVPLEPDGSISEEYVKRWAAFLNDMAIKGIWRYGTLSPPSTIRLAMSEGMRWEKVIFTFIFTNGEKSTSELNEQVGFPVFHAEGSMALSSDWSKFPW